MLFPGAPLGDEAMFDLGGEGDVGWAEWLGDLDGDGVGEMAVGHSAGSGGSVVYSAGDLRGRFLRDEDGYLGTYDEIHGFGDLTGDGVTDFGNAWGQVLCDGAVARGFAGWLGELPGCQSLGDPHIPAGDVDGDGVTDLIVNAGESDLDLLQPGRLFSAGLPLSASLSLGGIRNAQVARMGADVTGDGLADVILGDWYFQGDTGMETGRVVIFASEDLAPALAAVSTPQAPRGGPIG